MTKTFLAQKLPFDSSRGLTQPAFFQFLVMKYSAIAIIAALLCGIPAIAGTISGNVHAEGKNGADSGNSASDGAYASRKYKFVQKVDYTAMHDFIVYIEGPVGTNAPVVTNLVSVSTKRIAQRGACLSPHVL